MTTETLIQIAIVVLGSNWFGAFLMEVYKTKTKKKTPSEVILRSLARSHLLQAAERYKKQGFIDSEEYDDIFKEYDAYDKLGGNGRVKREYGEGGALQKLPVK